MSTFDEQSYRDGYWVGQIIGALTAGITSLSSTLPASILPQHRAQIEELAQLRGLVVKFDEFGVSISERQPPKLEVVN